MSADTHDLDGREHGAYGGAGHTDVHSVGDLDRSAEYVPHAEDGTKCQSSYGQDEGGGREGLGGAPGLQEVQDLEDHHGKAEDEGDRRYEGLEVVVIVGQELVSAEEVGPEEVHLHPRCEERGEEQDGPHDGEDPHELGLGVLLLLEHDTGVHVGMLLGVPPLDDYPAGDVQKGRADTDDDVSESHAVVYVVQQPRDHEEELEDAHEVGSGQCPFGRPVDPLDILEARVAPGFDEREHAHTQCDGESQRGDGQDLGCGDAGEDDYESDGGLEEHGVHGYPVDVGLGEHVREVPVLGHDLDRPGGSEERGLDDHHHSGDQKDDGNRSSDVPEVALGDRDEGRGACGVDAGDAEGPVHAEGDHEVHEQTEETAGHQCLGDVLAGLLVLRTIGGGGLPSDGTPLCHGEASEDHQDRVAVPLPSCWDYFVGYVVHVEVPGEEGDHDDDQDGDDGDGGQYQLGLRTSLETFPSRDYDESVYEDPEKEIEQRVGGTGESEFEIIVDVDTGHYGEDRDDRHPCGEIRPGPEGSDHTAVIDLPALVFLIIPEDMLDGSPDTCHAEGGAHLPERDVQKESGKDREHPYGYAHGPEIHREIAQRRYDQDRDPHGDNETLFPVDAPHKGVVGHRSSGCFDFVRHCIYPVSSLSAHADADRFTEWESGYAKPFRI